MVKASKPASDHSDHSDHGPETREKKSDETSPKIFTGVEKVRSDRSDRSDSKQIPATIIDYSIAKQSSYYDLIHVGNLPNIGQYYSCKEHLDIWDVSLKGLEISHFKPFHTDRQTEMKEGIN